jgi:ABC-type transport system involved in cytochrome bd biosynthesis fused ATPase/permease subunit
MEIGASDAASVGQRVLSYLKYAMSEEYKSILLDEWDANLDAKNTSAIDNELNILSKTRLVIEIRHSRT